MVPARGHDGPEPCSMGVEVMTQRRDPVQIDGGFSLLEVLVASVIMLVIALGMVPLFTRSISSNIEGFESTEVANHAKSRAEEFLQYGFNAPRLTVPFGQDALEVVDYYSNAQERWVDTVPSGEVSLFTRTTRVRQFGFNDLTTPLSGSTPSDGVHLKEITVTIQGAGLNGAFGTGKQISVRVFKSQ